MFNLKTAISTWRRSFELNRAFHAEDIEELERHIRDHVKAALADPIVSLRYE
jgi:hypothetical protein